MRKTTFFCTRVPFSPFHLYGCTTFYHFKRSAVLEYTTYFFTKATFRGPDPLNYTSYARRTTPPQCSARTCARLTTGRVVSSASINHDALVNMFATLFYHLFLKWLVRKAAQKFSFVFRYVCVTVICLTIYDRIREKIEQILTTAAEENFMSPISTKSGVYVQLIMLYTIGLVTRS